MGENELCFVSDFCSSASLGLAVLLGGTWKPIDFRRGWLKHLVSCSVEAVRSSDWTGDRRPLESQFCSGVRWPAWPFTGHIRTGFSMLVKSPNVYQCQSHLCAAKHELSAPYLVSSCLQRKLFTAVSQRSIKPVPLKLVLRNAGYYYSSLAA